MLETWVGLIRIQKIKPPLEEKPNQIAGQVYIFGRELELHFCYLYYFSLSIFLPYNQTH